MSCTTRQDCPSDATCRDGSDGSCDGTRLPSGDGANPGELVVSADGLTVTDTITGLAWQRDGSGTRAGCSGSFNHCTTAEAQAYCASLTLGGVSDWRLPTLTELGTIVDFTRTHPSIDQTVFPSTPSGWFWTSTRYRGISGVDFYISFGDGTPGYCGDSYGSVRCVRGSRCYPPSRFVVLDGGLIRDLVTELVWQQQASSTQMSWADAQSYCSSSGFRLPTLKELGSLVDFTVASGPTIDNAFPNTGKQVYWTSTLYPALLADSSAIARFADLSGSYANSCEHSSVDYMAVSYPLRVRCVR
jgi:hypothetical protein